MRTPRTYSTLICQRGVSLIEVIVAVAIFTLSTSFFFVNGWQGLDLAASAQLRMRAELKVEESFLALSAMRFDDPSVFVAGTYGIGLLGGAWSLLPAQLEEDGITRSVTITDEGAGRKKALIEVAWQDSAGISRTITAASFLHQIFGAAWSITTLQDWSGGYHNGVEEYSAGDGAVRLKGMGNWGSAEEFAQVDVPDLTSARSMAAYQNVLYMSASGGIAEAVHAVDLRDASRENFSIIASYVPSAPVNALAANERYLFLATAGNAEEVIVLLRRDLSFVRAMNLSGNADALALLVSGNRLWVGRANSTQAEVVEVDVSSPASALPILASAQDTGSVRALAVASGVLLVGSTADGGELSVLQQGNLALVNMLDMSGTANINALAVRGATLYAGRASSGSTEVVAIDITLPATALPILSSAEAGGTVTSMSVPGDGRVYVGTSRANGELLIFQESALTSISTVNIFLGSGSGSSVVYGPYAYIGLNTMNPEIVVVRGGPGAWSSPQLLGALDLSGSNDGRDVILSGTTATLVRGSGTGDDLATIDVSSPGTPQLLGGFDLAATGYALAGYGPYVYVATGHNSRELSIVNIAAPALPTLAGSYNANGNTDALAIAASGTTVFLGTQNNTAGAGREVYILNAANPNAVTLLGSIEVGAHVNGLSYHNGYLFGATANDAKEFIVWNVANPASPVEVSSYDTSGTADGLRALAVGGTAIMTTENNAAVWDLYFFGFSTTTQALTLQSFLDLGANVRSLARAGDVLFVGTESATQGLRVLDVSNFSSPQYLGIYNSGGSAFGISSDGANAFIASANNGAEFSIVGPLSASSELAKSGWYTSLPFDAGNVSTDWRTIGWELSGTGTVRMQTRTALSAAELSLAEWVGATGVGGFYATSGDAVVIAPGAGGTEWIEVRGMIEGDGTTTPFLLDSTITYQ